MTAYDKEELYKRTVHLYLESNPNPNSLKFVANFMLVPEGENHDFPNKAAASSSPLALALFEQPGVDRVFIMSNFVTVTKKNDVEWGEIQESLKDFIKSYLEEDKPIFNEDEDMETQQNQDSEEVAKIKGILDEYIRPAVEQDGGAIVFDSFEEGIVKVQLQGSCSGCPSSTITLKAGIENLLKSMMPEVHSVEAESV